jgi:hypothetical protein
LWSWELRPKAGRAQPTLSFSSGKIEFNDGYDRII